MTYLGVEQVPDLNVTRGFEVCYTQPRTRESEM